MFQTPPQSSSPYLGFDDCEFGLIRAAGFEFDGASDPYQNFNFNFLDRHVSPISNSVGRSELMTSGAPIGVFSDSEVQIQAEAGQTVLGLQQQQAEVASSHSEQAQARGSLSEVPEQPRQPRQARSPIRCTEAGCHSEFGTERELQRHRETVHDGSDFPCAVVGCKRGVHNPFNRLDNLQRHMRKAHGQSGQTFITAPRNMTMRGQKRRAETSPEPVSSSERRRRKTEDAQDSVDLKLNPLPASGHSQDKVASLQEQLAEARRREDIHVARIKTLEQEVEAHAAKFEALRKDNEVQDAYIKYLGRKA